MGEFRHGPFRRETDSLGHRRVGWERDKTAVLHSEKKTNRPGLLERESRLIPTLFQAQSTGLRANKAVLCSSS